MYSVKKEIEDENRKISSKENRLNCRSNKCNIGRPKGAELRIKTFWGIFVYVIFQSQPQHGT